MEFKFSENGKKSLLNLEKDLRKRILIKISFWNNSGEPLNYAKKIEGYKFYKYRVGNYRIIVLPNFKKNTIKILRVDHRGNVYKNLDRL